MQRLEALLAPSPGLSLRFVLVSVHVLNSFFFFFAIRSNTVGEMTHWISATNAENLLLANFILCDNNMLTNACKMMTGLEYRSFYSSFRSSP